MKHKFTKLNKYTDGIYTVEATCKGIAFDMLAELHGHYNIGEITEVVE